jgi:hypothetical protein
VYRDSILFIELKEEGAKVNGFPKTSFSGAALAAGLSARGTMTPH